MVNGSEQAFLYAKGKAKGKAEGKAEGKYQQAVESEKKMLNKGYKKEEISELLGLRIEEVEKF